MTRRLQLDPSRVRVVPNGISVAGYDVAGVLSASGPPVLGYFARMCREKGLDLLVDAYLLIRQRNRVPHLRLQIGGGCGPSDEPFVAEMKQRLHQAGALADTTFHPNLTREQKIAFLKSLSVFSVPAHYGEAFGLYILEALAAGVPVVQPKVAAFTELVESTGGGLLCAPRSAAALAETIENLLLDPSRRRRMGETGREAVRLGFTARRMAENIVKVSSEAMSNRTAFTRKKRAPA
jgi:glycosyltransferase involved in cell wall biosynthesis